MRTLDKQKATRQKRVKRTADYAKEHADDHTVYGIFVQSEIEFHPRFG